MCTDYKIDATLVLIHDEDLHASSLYKNWTSRPWASGQPQGPTIEGENRNCLLLAMDDQNYCQSF